MAEELTLEQCTKFATECREMAKREKRPEIRKRLDDLAASWEQVSDTLSGLAELEAARLKKV